MIKIDITITSEGEKLSITKISTVTEPVTKAENDTALGIEGLYKAYTKYHGFTTVKLEAPDDPNTKETL